MQRKVQTRVRPVLGRAGPRLCFGGPGLDLRFGVWTSHAAPGGAAQDLGFLPVWTLKAASSLMKKSYQSTLGLCRGRSSPLGQGHQSVWSGQHGAWGLWRPSLTIRCPVRTRSFSPSPPSPPRQWALVFPLEEEGSIPGPPVSIPWGGICPPTLRNQGGTAEGKGLLSTFPSMSLSSLQGIRGTVAGGRSSGSEGDRRASEGLGRMAGPGDPRVTVAGGAASCTHSWLTRLLLVRERAWASAPLLGWASGSPLCADRASLGEKRCRASAQQGDLMSPLSGGIWQSRRNPSDSYVDSEGRGDKPRSPWNVSAKPCPAEGGREWSRSVLSGSLQPHGQ